MLFRNPINTSSPNESFITTGLRLSPHFPPRVPLHTLATAVRFDGRPHGDNSVVTGHHVALQSLAAADDVLQIAVMQRDGFAACLLVNDLRLVAFLVEAPMRSDNETIAREFERGLVAAPRVRDGRVVATKGKKRKTFTL